MGNIYKADVFTSPDPRQLFVNGQRAIRARGESDPAGFTKTATGYTIADDNMKYKYMQYWRNTSDIEFVDFTVWKSFRCGVASISGNDITMKQPCWGNSQRTDKAEWNMGLPTWIENAYPLLDQPGEWYLDEQESDLYYIPRAGESMSTASVVAPTLETLVSGTGTFDQPIHNIQLRGIKFSYATWLRPSTTEGYASSQAGFTFTGDPPGTNTKPPANVTFHTAKSIRLEGNEFKRLGGTALNFEFGSQNNAIVGNTFSDISGSGVYLGDASSHPSDPRNITKNNEVSNNVITRIGAEYHDSVGIWAGYTDSSTISHNELYDLPYSAISVGWGWGNADPGGGDPNITTSTPARNNVIDHNRIDEYGKVLNDVGGIYTLGAQPGSQITDNYISGQRNEVGDGGAIYHDQGTKYYTVNRNVAEEVPYSLLIWHWSAQYNAVRYTYADTDVGQNQGKQWGNTVENFTIVENGNWPPEAINIMNNAGVTAPYR